MEKCPICDGCSTFFSRDKHREYLICGQCEAIFVPKKYHLSKNHELERYLKHQNNFDDKGYLDFLKPLVNHVERNFSCDHVGLDFGSGPNDVLTRWLQNLGYNIQAYDPYFMPRNRLLEGEYDYIVACEVIEHFRQPAEEFSLMLQLLKENGILICRTSLFSSDIQFSSWYYKNDKTHLVFYQEKTLWVIKKLYGFSTLSVSEPLIVFKK